MLLPAIWWPFAQAAQETPPSAASIAATLMQQGTLGIIVLVLGWFARGQITREQTRADRLEQQLLERDTWHQERTIPALVEVTKLMQEIRADIARERERERGRQ